jgi:dolichyl-diphosphooligosaccharide--protein glycosyltransferase
LVAQTNLFQIGTFNFNVKHLLIIGILVLSFSISFLIRSQNLDYGFELNEFDPFFNFRATEYIVENGFSEYFNWHDDKSWYPKGRDVSATSQVMLHVTAAITYQVFGGNSSLYDFTILFPVVIGSLTVIVVFVLVRLFGGTNAGLFASLFFAVSLPIIMRGTAGWFKSEPLGIFYGLLGLYLFLSGIKSKNKKITILKIVFGGIAMSFGITSWGGNQFFIIPVGLFILALPFVRKDHKFLLWSIPLFTLTFLLVTSMFERPGPNFVFGLGGFSLIVPTVFLIICIFIQKISKEENKIRNGLILLVSIIVIGSFLVTINAESNFLPLPSFRYLNAINPFLTTTNPLVDSVSEHSTTTISQSFLLHSIFMIFSGIGIWLMLSKKISQTEIFVKNDMKAFVLIMGITGVYVSSAFLRLEVFASLSLIILSSIGLSILTTEIFKIKSMGKKNYLLKISYVVIIMILFIIPITFPANGNWISTVDIPPTILNGGTTYPASNDWLETLEWLKMNTTQDAVIASWWDYGYWITTMSERTTLADNATIDTKQIQKIAKIFLSTPDAGWNMLREMNADYVVVFVAAQKLNVDHEGRPLYVLGGGGDESKKQWFMRIAEEPLQKYLHSDGISGTDYFWNETMLGNMIPFTPLAYHNFQNQQQSEIFTPGFSEITTKEIKYDSDDDPLKLIYASSSFIDEKNGPMTGVFVYEVNHNYVSNLINTKNLDSIPQHNE